MEATTQTNAATNEIEATIQWGDSDILEWGGHRGLVASLKAAEWEAPSAPRTLEVDGQPAKFVRHVSDEAAKVDRYIYAVAE